MAKSKYPDKLDTSIEIPAVRDNIIEIGSDVLNSVRTAIFQIERTLGINPQGAVGNTVSDRLNKSLDGNGNILKEALDRANVLSGPVVDKDVSKNAAINESKLRLDYPTQLLQDEISQIISQLTIILTTLEELAVLLNAHVHPDATNRHYAKAITVEAIDSTGSEVGMVSVDVATAQDVFEQIFQSHINYDGSNISISNRSHEADQLFFDNEDVSAYTSAEDVQEAIEDVYEYTIGQLDIHQNKQHDNGILKSSVITSPEDSDEGVLLVEESGVNYSATSPSEIKQAVVVRFDDPPDTPEIEIKKSDILKITDNSGSTEYQIFKVNYSASGSTIESVEVYGHFIESSSSVSAAKIYRNMNKEANHGGLLTTAREYQSITATSYSNADIIQIANPDASTIISNHINPSEISLTNRYFNITVDDGSEIELDIYDGTAASQSLDTIIKNLNAQFSENALSVSAYRVDYDENKSPELALVHSIPSDTSSSHTLMVSRGSDDALDSLGLERFEDTTINSGLGTAYYIQGTEYSSLGTKMAEIGLTLLSGTASVTSSTVDFKEYGIREGDLLVVSGSPSDDGTYVILLVTTSSLVVDRNQLSGNKWSGESDAETEFYIYKNSISLNQMEFDISGTGGANGSICDVFMDYNRNVFYNVRLEYGIEALPAGNSLISIVDFIGDVSSYEGTLLAEPDDAASPAYTILTLDDGPIIELKGVKNQYIELKSGTHDVTLLIYIEDSDNILTFFGSASDITIPILGHEGVNEEENMLLSRALFESGSARIAGAGAEFPRLFRKMRRGNISQKDLGTDAIYANQQRPLKETRSNGVIFGLEVSPSATSIDANNHYAIDIVPGVCYVKGKRFEINKKENLITGIVAAPTGPDNFFVAVDQWGSIVFAPADGVTCECPFDPYDYCILSSIEYDLATVVAIDLRLFIDNLDLTVLNSITVSPQKGMGHFSDINKALKYAKRFSKLFAKAGAPTIHLKSGTHKVKVDMKMETAAWTGWADVLPQMCENGIYVDFPVNITGEGQSTVLDLSHIFDDYLNNPDIRATDSTNQGWAIIAGPGLSSSLPGHGSAISSGFITLKNFKLRLSRIAIIDSAIKDASGNNLNWGVNIDNVIFDFSEFSAGQSADTCGLMCVNADLSSSGGGSDEAGNISVKNCQFLNSAIYFDYDANLSRNISILNNVFRGTGDGASDGSGNYAIHSAPSGSIFDFSDALPENNIEFRGNVIADNATTDTAAMDQDGNYPWGDRVSRNLCIGNRVAIGHSDPYVNSNLHIDSNENASILLTRSSSGGIEDGDDLGEIVFGGSDDNGDTWDYSSSKILATAAENWDIGDTETGSRLEFFTTETGSSTPESRLVINDDGMIGVGCFSNTQPLQDLHINAYADGDAIYADLLLTREADDSLDAGDVLGRVVFGGTTDNWTTDHTYAASIQARTTQDDWDTDEQNCGTNLTFHITPDDDNTLNTNLNSIAMIIDQSGFVGVGLPHENAHGLVKPEGELHVNAHEDGYPELWISRSNDDSIEDGDHLGKIIFGGNTEDGEEDKWAIGAEIFCEVDTDVGGWDTGSLPGSENNFNANLRFRVNDGAGTVSTRMNIKHDGCIQMGRASVVHPDTYTLDVHGDRVGHVVHIQNESTDDSADVLHLSSSIEGSTATSLMDWITFDDADGPLGTIHGACDSGGDLRFSGEAAGTYSDLRIKENISDVNNSELLSQTLSLDLFSYNLIFDKAKTVKVGFSAQQLSSLFPQSVYDPDKLGKNKNKETGEVIEPGEAGYQYMKVNDGSITPLLVGAIKEQQLIIERLEKRISDLEKKDNEE